MTGLLRCELTRGRARAHGETYQAAGDPRSARRAWQQALELYEGLHHPAAELMRARLDQLPGPMGLPAV